MNSINPQTQNFSRFSHVTTFLASVFDKIDQTDKTNQTDQILALPPFSPVFLTR